MSKNAKGEVPKMVWIHGLKDLAVAVYAKGEEFRLGDGWWRRRYILPPSSEAEKLKAAVVERGMQYAFGPASDGQLSTAFFDACSRLRLYNAERLRASGKARGR